jgi:hypothetical protein
LLPGKADNYAIADNLSIRMFEIRDKISATAAISSATLARLEERANVEKRRGELDQAISTLFEALLIRKTMLSRLKEAGFDTTAEVHALVHLLQQFGSVFYLKGDDTNAERAFKDANKLSRKCAAAGWTEISLRINIPTQHTSLNCYICGHPP